MSLSLKLGNKKPTKGDNMNKDQKEKLAHLKHEASRAKHELMDICRDIEIEISPSKAKKLERIIEKLEAWQNS